ncbi:MAG TPA: insulinase family protein [Candidatus Lustribacter sp.]|nr:insulinase family protein [Candidatus Lustribacter sp.]
MMRQLLLAATLALTLAAAPRAVDLGNAKMYAQSDDGAQLTGVEIIVSAGTARQTVAQNGLAALTAQTLLFTKVNGTRLSDRIAAAGGSVDYAVAPGTVRFSLEVLPSALGSVSADFARVLAAPDTSADNVAAAREAVGVRIDAEERNPVTVGVEMLHSAYYSGTAGAPEYGTRASLAQLGPSDVSAFLAAHYLRGNTFATATGLVDDTASAAVNTVIGALPDGSETPPAVTAQAFPAEPRHLVTSRDIGVPFAFVGFAAPAMSDRQFAAMLVMRSLLNDVAARQSTTTLATYQRGINIVYAYDVKPATFTVAINGSQLDPTAGLTVLQAILKTALTKPLAPDVLKRFQETARGEWALEAVTLTDRAWLIGAAVNEGGDPGLAQSVDAAIGRVTSADVQALAKAYLQRYTVALVLPRRRN